MSSISSVDALESLAVGAVAITTLALAQAGVELTFAQWRALMVIGDGPDGATVSEIAEQIGSAMSPASRLVARMRDRDLVQAEKDARDHRATRVHLTARGSEVRERVVARRRELLEAAMGRCAPLSPDLTRACMELATALRTRS